VSKYVLCQSADGWSLHAPGSTDEQIASGDAPPIITGAGEPDRIDYVAADLVDVSREMWRTEPEIRTADFETFCQVMWSDDNDMHSRSMSKDEYEDALKAAWYALKNCTHEHETRTDPRGTIAPR
jgi:hypothetical protein